MSVLRETAERWARADEIGRAVPVAPSVPGEKRALLPAGRDGSGGYNRATVDLEQIAAWWTRTPAAGVAVHLDRGGLVALDVEGPGKGVDPFDVVSAIHAARLVLPPTRLHRTPGGGFHYLYRRAPGTVAGDYRTRVPGVGGVEIKRSGVVLVPPSTVAGRRYEVVVAEPVAVAPAWMLTPARARAAVRRGVVNDDRARRLLERHAGTVRDARSGDVNPALCRAAYVVGGLVGAGRLDREVARAALREAAIAAGHGLTGDRPDPRAVAAMDRTLDAALDRGALAPWGSA